MTPLLYRSATLADLDAICQLGDQITAIHHSARPQYFAPTGPAERDRPVWQACLENPDAKVFVAEENATVLGFIDITLINETHPLATPLRYARIGSVCVDEANRGRGIGAQLMAEAENWAKAQGVQEVRLTVWDFNETALRLYQEIGYQPRSRTLTKGLV